MERWSETLVRALRGVLARPRTAAAFACGAAIALAGLVSWSCQTAPAVPRSASTGAPPREPDVRVRIKNGVEKVRLEGPAELVVEFAAKATKVMPTPVVVEATSAGFNLTDRWGKVFELTTTSPVEVSAKHEGSAKKPARIKVDGAAYPGRLWLMPKGGPAPMAQLNGGTMVLASGVGRSTDPAKPESVARGTMDVIEIVPLEMYLVGVLPSELPGNFHQAAFHAQAVCARTYALHERERSTRGGKDFDLEAGELDQAYNGGPELAIAQRAVADTRGVVLTWNGTLLRTYYSSTCGGRSASAAEVWPTGEGFEFNSAAPLQGKPRDHACQISPLYTWTVTRPLDELSTRIREWGKANGHPARHIWTVAKLEVEKRNATGRPSRYILTDSRKKEVPITAELLRVACNYSGGGSGPAAALPKIVRDTRVNSGDIEIEVTGKAAVIRGRGFGHGVGMCQYCIDAMGERGASWREMLPLFYPGAKVERAY